MTSTHDVTDGGTFVVAAFGGEWSGVNEGEATVFKPQANGKPEVVARVQAAEWVKAARGGP